MDTHSHSHNRTHSPTKIVAKSQKKSTGGAGGRDAEEAECSAGGASIGARTPEVTGIHIVCGVLAGPVDEAKRQRLCQR